MPVATIDRSYRLRRRIAIGGMAEVFLANLEGPRGEAEPVVVKKILRRWAHNDDVLSLFRDEARIGSRLNHRNVVRVLDYGRSGEDTYLVLEYVEGNNLAELIGSAASRGRYLQDAAVVHVICECCSGLDHIHRRTDSTGEHLGVVHRDINPANILISRSGSVKLTDFGVAAGLHRELKTAHGILRGTFPYMSPEQTLCQPVDGRSDIFSLGVCLYEALTTRHPFAADQDYQTIRNIQDRTPPPPETHRPDIDLALSRIVMRCLEKDPTARYSAAWQLQNDLSRWLLSKRRPYQVSDLSQLMQVCFPDPENGGDPVAPTCIRLGPTSPGAPNPLLDVSLLQTGKRRRVGGVIKPRESEEQEDLPPPVAPPGAGEPVQIPAALADSALPAEPPVIRGRSPGWNDLNRSGRRGRRFIPSQELSLEPRGPLTLEGIKQAQAPPPERRSLSPLPQGLGWLLLLGGLAAALSATFFVF